MSRTEKNPLGRRHREWWGKRPVSIITVNSGRMRFWKRRLHKLERRIDATDLTDVCPECRGSGEHPDNDLILCLRCLGWGEVPA